MNAFFNAFTKALLHFLQHISASTFYPSPKKAHG